MLTGQLQGLTGTRAIGPAREFRIERASLLIDGNPFAIYTDGTWDCSRLSGTSIPIGPEAMIRCENGSFYCTHGPCKLVRLVDGSIYADDLLLAQFDEDKKEWVLTKDKSRWPRIIIRRPHRF